MAWMSWTSFISHSSLGYILTSLRSKPINTISTIPPIAATRQIFHQSMPCIIHSCLLS